MNEEHIRKDLVVQVDAQEDVNDKFFVCLLLDCALAFR